MSITDKVKPRDINIVSPIAGQVIRYDNDGQFSTVAGSGGGPGQDGGTNLTSFPVMAGEDLGNRDATFIEEYTSFAEAITAQNVGDVVANTRVSSVAFGSGVSGSSIVLKLGKTGIPTPDLEVRIETDNAGVPSGTLLNANATGTIAQSVITAISNYTINFAGAFTITRGQKVHVVIRQVGDVVNAGNYYTVYFANKDTTTRGYRLWNGTRGANNTTRLLYIQNDADNGLFNGPDFEGTYSTTGLAPGRFVGVRFTALIGGIGIKFEKPNTSTATHFAFYDATGNVLQNSAFVGNIATIIYPIIAGTSYSITAGDPSLLHTGAYNASKMLPQNNQYIQITASANDMPPLGNPTISGSTPRNIKHLSIISANTDLLENPLLSKTNTNFAHKTAFYGLATQTYTAGQDALVYKVGEVDGFVGLVNGARYYLDTVSGGLTTTPNSYQIGIAKNSTTLVLGDGLVELPLGTSFSISGGNGSTTNSTTYTAPADGILVLRCNTQEDGSNVFVNVGGVVSCGPYTRSGEYRRSSNDMVMMTNISETGQLLVPFTKGQTRTITISRTGGPTVNYVGSCTATLTSFIYNI